MFLRLSKSTVSRSPGRAARPSPLGRLHRFAGSFPDRRPHGSSLPRHTIWGPGALLECQYAAEVNRTMCNDYGNHVPYSAYVAAFSQIRIPFVAQQNAPNLEPRDDIWPTEQAPVIRRAGKGVELAQLKWGLDPGRPKAAPVINFRSEGRRFANGRCLVPASHFFEFTGARSPKAKWKFTLAGEDWFCFAGLWRSSRKGGDAFTILTTAPGPDVAPIHNRQVVVLGRAAWMAWLDLTRSEADLPAALPVGSLHAEQVR